MKRIDKEWKKARKSPKNKNLYTSISASVFGLIIAILALIATKNIAYILCIILWIGYIILTIEFFHTYEKSKDFIDKLLEKVECLQIENLKMKEEKKMDKEQIKQLKEINKLKKKEKALVCEVVATDNDSELIVYGSGNVMHAAKMIKMLEECIVELKKMPGIELAMIMAEFKCNMKKEKSTFKE